MKNFIFIALGLLIGCRDDQETASLVTLKKQELAPINFAQCQSFADTLFPEKKLIAVTQEDSMVDVAFKIKKDPEIICHFKY